VARSEVEFDVAHQVATPRLRSTFTVRHKNSNRLILGAPCSINTLRDESRLQFARPLLSKPLLRLPRLGMCILSDFSDVEPPNWIWWTGWPSHFRRSEIISPTEPRHPKGGSSSVPFVLLVPAGNYPAGVLRARQAQWEADGHEDERQGVDVSKGTKLASRDTSNPKSRGFL